MVTARGAAQESGGIVKRNTRQRDIVTRVLDGQTGFLSAQDLHHEIELSGQAIGLATVYRALTALVEEGRVDVLASSDGTSMYRACATAEHHHHLICRECGHAKEIEAQAVEAWAREVARAHGFTQARHVVDVFGVCPDCAS